MKTAKCLFVFAAAFALSFSAFGKTGAEAAGGISSDPGAKKQLPDKASFEMAYYNKNTKSYEITQFYVGEDLTWDDVLDIVQDININLTAVAADIMAALAKVAYLEAVNEYTQARIDTLTETTRAAFESLDTLTLKDVDNAITKVLTKQPKADDGKSGITYIGGNIFNVAGAQADGLSIKSNSNDRLEVARYSTFKNTKGVQPYNRGGDFGLFWDNPWTQDDGVSVEFDVDEYQRPTKSGNKHGIHIKGWYDQGQCEEKLSQMLTDPNDSVNRNAHNILCRVNTGNDAVLHYLPLGDVIQSGGGAIKFVGTEGDPAVVGSGSKTNTVTFAKFNDSNIRIKVESDNNGNATITFGVYYK